MRAESFPAVVIPDVHGRRDLLLRALQGLGLAGPGGDWRGGRRRLVQLGDVIDRGPEGLAVMDLLIRLQAQARAAGGEVTCLLGNHEWLALGAAAGSHRQRMLWGYAGGAAVYREWLGRYGRPGDDRDLPYPEDMYALFGPDAPYGRWLRTHRVACRLGDYVAVHAGWPREGPDSVAAANALWAGAPSAPAAFLAAYDAPGALGALESLLDLRHRPADQVRAACARLGCRGLIVGHTAAASLRVACGGQLILADVGMGMPGIDTWAALGLDQDGRLWSLMEGRTPLPLPGDGCLPLPTGAMHAGPGEPARYGPGGLVLMYRAPDGSWSHYLHIRGFGSVDGHWRVYTGLYITRDRGRWSTRPGRLPVEWIDRYGRPAHPAEVPDSLLTG